MELNKVKLGQFIKQSDSRNSELLFGEDAVVGISTQKDLIPTKANLNGVSLSSYEIVKPNEFVYVPDTSRRGDKIALALNTTNSTFLVSSIYTVFYVDDTDRLLSDYLFMFFNRPEFDRYARTNSWGSARETFSWEDMCDMELDLPDLPTQEKYVAIYKAMQANQQSYERGLEDLKTACFARIEKMRKEYPLSMIGEYIQPYKGKNSDGLITLEQGINIEKQFITPQRSNSNLTGRKIVRHGQFAYCTQLNNANVAIAYREGEDCVVSSVYDVFEITRKKELLPHYLMLWLIRPEFGRYVYWASEGSAYEFLNYNNLAGYRIPVPSIEQQKAVADLYQCYVTRKRINEQLKAQLRKICPILIRGSLSDGG